MSVLRDVATTAIRRAAARSREQANALPADAQTDVLDPCNGLAESCARLRAAAARAGFADDDPLGVVLSALADLLGAVGTVTGEHARRLQTLQAGAREVAQLEIDRARQEIAAAESATVGRISSAIAASADAALARRVRVFDRNTALAATGILCASIGIAAGGGYLRGSVTGRAEVVRTEQKLAAAFRAGASGASAWLTLMTANDPTQALAECHGAALWIDKATGRRACRVPLWLDPPSPTAPNEARSQ